MFLDVMLDVTALEAPVFVRRFVEHLLKLVDEARYSVAIGSLGPVCGRVKVTLRRLFVGLGHPICALRLQRGLRLGEIAEHREPKVAVEGEQTVKVGKRSTRLVHILSCRGCPLFVDENVLVAVHDGVIALAGKNELCSRDIQTSGFEYGSLLVDGLEWFVHGTIPLKQRSRPKRRLLWTRPDLPSPSLITTPTLPRLS